MKLNINAGLILRILAGVLLLVLAWYFSDLVLYIFLAFIFSLIGKPIATKISSARIFKRNIPYGVSSMMAMLFFILVFSLILFFFIPMLTREARAIANINYDELSVSLNYLLDSLQDFLHENGLMDNQETLVGLVTSEIKDFASLTAFSSILGQVVSLTGSFLFALFSVFFLTFFFIKDDFRIDNLTRVLFNARHAVRLTSVSEKINNLLSRYFIGLLIEIVSMITLLYIGMAIFGIKGALLMAFFGGMLNAIPYLGPLIGTICACLFGVVDCLSGSNYQAIFPTILQIGGTFIAANLIDNIVLQPIIYSQSVKAHPVEIFLVIIMGGSLAGIPGMLFAIPVYTIVRTVTVELFNYAHEK